MFMKTQVLIHEYYKHFIFSVLLSILAIPAVRARLFYTERHKCLRIWL